MTSGDVTRSNYKYVVEGLEAQIAGKEEELQKCASSCLRKYTEVVDNFHGSDPQARRSAFPKKVGAHARAKRGRRRVDEQQAAGIEQTPPLKCFFALRADCMAGGKVAAVTLWSNGMNSTRMDK